MNMLWTFGRGSERVRIERSTQHCELVVVATPAEPRRYPFKDWARLNAFQADMEAFLLKTGWTLIEYSPERRGGRDRRGFPRLEERRRWWTDPAELRKSVLSDKTS